jgi:hypothetical protein
MLRVTRAPFDSKLLPTDGKALPTPDSGNMVTQWIGMDMEGSGQIPTWWYIVPVFVQKGGGKLRKAAVTVTVLWAEIWTQDRWNMTQKF